MARPYRALSAVPVVPSFEIIATVAQRSAGSDGDYSAESSVASLRPWVEAAGRHGMIVLLDLQPGRAGLLDQAVRYAELLRLPHVGLAVDPEWKLGPNQRPCAGSAASTPPRSTGPPPGWPPGPRPTTCRRSCSWCTSSGCR